MAFIDLMKEKARQNRKTIVLPESEDQRTLTAAAQILKEGTADLILVGNAETIKKDAAALNADIEGVKIVDPETDPKFDHYAETLFKLREKKGMNPEKGHCHLKERSYYLRRYDGKGRRCRWSCSRCMPRNR